MRRLLHLLWLISMAVTLPACSPATPQETQLQPTVDQPAPVIAFPTTHYSTATEIFTLTPTIAIETISPPTATLTITITATSTLHTHFHRYRSPPRLLCSQPPQPASPISGGENEARNRAAERRIVPEADVLCLPKRRTVMFDKWLSLIKHLFQIRRIISPSRLNFIFAGLILAGSIPVLASSAPLLPVCYLQGSYFSSPYLGRTVRTRGVVTLDLDQASQTRFLHPIVWLRQPDLHIRRDFYLPRRADRCGKQRRLGGADRHCGGILREYRAAGRPCQCHHPVAQQSIALSDRVEPPFPEQFGQGIF